MLLFPAPIVTEEGKKKIFSVFSNEEGCVSRAKHNGRNYRGSTRRQIEATRKKKKGAGSTENAVGRHSNEREPAPRPILVASAKLLQVSTGKDSPLVREKKRE